MWSFADDLHEADLMAHATFIAINRLAARIKDEPNESGTSLTRKQVVYVRTISPRRRVGQGAPIGIFA
jgi:hypothetical protein